MRGSEFLQATMSESTKQRSVLPSICTIARNENAFDCIKNMLDEKALFSLWQTISVIAKLKTATDRLLQWKFQLQQLMHFDHNGHNFCDDDNIAEDALVIIAWEIEKRYYTFKNYPIYLSRGNDFEKATYRMRINRKFKRVKQIQNTWDAPHSFRYANYCSDLYPGENWTETGDDCKYESCFKMEDHQVKGGCSHVVITCICSKKCDDPTLHNSFWRNCDWDSDDPVDEPESVENDHPCLDRNGDEIILKLMFDCITSDVPYQIYVARQHFAKLGFI